MVISELNTPTYSVRSIWGDSNMFAISSEVDDNDYLIYHLGEVSIHNFMFTSYN